MFESNSINNCDKNNLNLLIEDINKNIFNWELTEIFEVTYSYKNIKWLKFNTTLFKDFLKLSSTDLDEMIKNKTLKWSYRYNIKLLLKRELYKLTKNKLTWKQKLIKKYIEEIKKTDKTWEEEKIISELLIWSLEYALKILEITKLWLVFELEKAWIQNNLSLEKKQEIIKQISYLEKDLFGWNIKNNSKEVILAYEFLRDRFEKNKNIFNSDEEEKYLEYLEKAEKYLPENYIYKFKKEEKNTEDNTNTEYLSNRISREKYIQILQDVFDLLKLDIEVRIEERGSIYDWEYHLWIPKNEKYNFLTIKRILELISHEIEAHTVNLRNNQKLIWYFRSAANLEKEEGIAIVMENLLNWKKIDNIWVPQHFSKVFMGEFLSWRELKEFLNLNNKIHPDTGHAWRFLRLKRNYDLNLPWVQHKDTSYGRWALKVVELLKKIKTWEEKEIEVRDLFLAKVWFKDILKAKKLMRLKWLEYNDLTMPLFIWEFVKYLFEIEANNKNSRNKIKISQENFIKKLRKKYDFINFDKIEIPVISFFEKKKIYNIIKTIKTIE